MLFCQMSRKLRSGLSREGEEQKGQAQELGDVGEHPQAPQAWPVASQASEARTRYLELQPETRFSSGPQKHTEGPCLLKVTAVTAVPESRPLPGPVTCSALSSGH